MRQVAKKKKKNQTGGRGEMKQYKITYNFKPKLCGTWSKWKLI